MIYTFIGSHTDEELCFGGFMAKMAEEGHRVVYVALSYCNDQKLYDECIRSTKILGADSVWIQSFKVRYFRKKKQSICDYLSGIAENTDYVITHSINDIHPDHRTVAQESRRIFKGNLVTYIGPWNGSENSNYFVGLSEQQLDKKIEALACYKSQAHRSYMHPEFIRAQAIYNGVRCGKKYAESFRCERLIT